MGKLESLSYGFCFPHDPRFRNALVVLEKLYVGKRKQISEIHFLPVPYFSRRNRSSHIILMGIQQVFLQQSSRSAFADHLLHCKGQSLRAEFRQKSCRSDEISYTAVSMSPRIFYFIGLSLMFVWSCFL